MLDEKDRSIIAELRKDSRQSTSDIARKTKIPRVTVHERIRRMREEGAIERFTVRLNGKKIGLPATIFVMVRVLPNDRADQAAVAQDVAKIPEVVEAYAIGGEWDIIAKVKGESIEQAGKAAIRKIRAVKGVERTLVMPSFEELKNE
jgi:DNA-binding Lrp family transcriptional regulator